MREREAAAGRVRPYVWAPPLDEVAARHGLHRAEVIRFDQNVPPLPGVPQVPLGESFARLNEYPDGTYRELREAAAAYAGVDPEQIVPGAGADGLIALAARTFLGPGRRAVRAASRPTRCTRSPPGSRAPRLTDDAWPSADLDLGLQPEQPDRRARRAGGDRRARARRYPDAAVVVDEAYFEYGGEDGRAARSRERRTCRAPDALEGVRPRGAAGRLRGRLARRRRASSTAAATRRPSPLRPRGSPPPRCANPRLDVEETIAERERMRAALARRRLRLPAVRRRTSSSSAPTPTGRRRARGAGPRRPPLPGRRSASRCASRPRTTGSSPRSAPTRRAVACPLRARRPHDRRDRAADLARPRRARPRARRHRDRLPRPPARRSSPSTAGSTSRCSPAATSTSTSTTRSRTCSPRSATRSASALDGRAGRDPLRLGDGADGRGARRPPPSTSSAARTPRSRSRSAATASAAWR